MIPVFQLTVMDLDSNYKLLELYKMNSRRAIENRITRNPVVNMVLLQIA